MELKKRSAESSPLLYTRFTSVLSAFFDLLPPPATFVTLTILFAHSAYWAWERPPELAFELFSYADMVALCGCREKFKRLGQDAKPERRERLKVAMWVLLIALNLAFAWQLVEILPLPLAIVIGCISSLFIVALFWGVLACEDLENDANKNHHSGELSPEDKV